MTTHLKMAVLRARSALDNQKSLLAKPKQDQQSCETSGEETSVSTAKKIDALGRTHDELIGWMEERLTEGSQSDKDASPQVHSKSQSGSLTIDEQKQEI